MTPAALAELVRARAVDVLTSRGLDSAALPATVTVQRPRNREHGDYATNLALQCARKLGVAPRDLAAWLAGALPAEEGIGSAYVAGPGFVNLRLAPAVQGELVRQVLTTGSHYGHGDAAETVAADIGDRFAAARGGPVATRAGTVVTIDDLIGAVGVDAARYAFVRSEVDSLSGIDLDVLRRHTCENPVFAVQFAHARLSSLLRNAAELGILLPADLSTVDFALLESERESDLMRALGEYPVVVAAAADLREPHRVARYLERLAAAFHEFAGACRVLPSGDEPVTALLVARLLLCQAARQVLANGLALLGISAPERM